MRLFKLFVGAASLFLVFLGLITVFLPSRITISRSVQINADEQAVKMQVTDFRNWMHWYPSFQNTHATVLIASNGDTSFAELKLADHQQLSLALYQPSENTIEVYFPGRDRKSEDYQFVLFKSSSGHTQLTWNARTLLGWYPWKKLGGIFLDKITGSQYEAALQNLKAAAEKVPR
jgi:hypothetical protein